MYFLDELVNFRMYKKQFCLPLNMNNKRKGSCALLLTPNVASTKAFFNNPLFVNRYYNGYYIERAVMYYINHESGNLISGDDKYITEEFSLFENNGKTKLQVEGYQYDIDKFKESVRISDFEKIAEKYKIKLPDTINVSVRRAGISTFVYTQDTIIMASYGTFNKSIFDSYYKYCLFCIYCYIMKLCNPIIDERLMVGAALYESGIYTKFVNASKWPMAYSFKLTGKAIDIYLSKHPHNSFVNKIIKGDNGLFKLEVPFGDAVQTIIYDGIIKPFYEENISSDYSKGMLQLSEDTVMLLEDSAQNTHIKKILYNDRLKSNKDLISLYKAMKEEFGFIKYTYTDLNMYKSMNMFFDLSGYNFSFIKNNVLEKKRGYELYMELMSRMINDPRLTENGYTKNTVIIPITDWFNACDKPDTMWLIKDTINPISCIYYSIYNNNFERIKEIFGRKTIIFTGEKSYFTVNFDTFDKDKDLPRFLRCIKNIILNVEVQDDDEPKDSEKAITVDIIDKVEKTQKVQIDNLEVKDEEEPKVNNTNGTSDNTEKAKKDVVKSVTKAAKGKNNVDDAMNALEDEERIKQALSNLAANPDSGSDLSAARSSRMLSLQQDFLDSEFNGKSVKEILKANSDEEYVEPKSLNVDSVNEEWEKLNYVAAVESYNLDADIVKIFRSFINKTKPLAIVDLKNQDTSTSEDSIITYTCVYEDSRGKRYTVNVDIPKILDNKYMKLRGNRKTIQPQLFLMPIIKTEEDTVQIVSCYKKIYISRFGTTSGKSNRSTDKLIKALTKHEYKSIKIIEGDNSRICSKYELPIDYIDISSCINKIENKSYIFFFNQDELRSKYTVDDSKGLPIGIDKKTKEVIYYNTDTFFGYYLYLMLSTSSGEDEKALIENYNNANPSVRYTYSRASVLDSKIPLIVVCAHSVGLEETMRRAHIEYKLYSDKKPPKNEEYDIIKFKDGWLEYKLDYNSSLLMNGLKACPVDECSVNDINKKYTYIDFLEMFGGRIKSDGLDNFFDCMIDPITYETLTHYKLPTDYIDVLLYGNALLADNKFVKHGNIRSTRRVRRIEQIADFLYKELSNAYGAYNIGIKHGRDIGFSIKQSAVIDAFMKNNTTSDQSVLNALGEYEDYNAVTPKGSSGMNSERAYSLDKRSFDESMINVMSTSTGFAGNVGITRQMTIDANVTGPRGYIYNDPDLKSGELNGVKALCMTEAVTPFGTTRDDPMRTAMNFIQTSKHSMRTSKSSPLLITNGADEALPYLISDTFAFKAKNNGKVVEITDEFMVVEYTDGTKDFVDLSDKVQKNSSSGFYITIKLSTKLKVGSKFKKDDIIAYDEPSFSDSIGASDCISYNIGPMVKFAILNTNEGYEDSAIVSEKLSEDLASGVVILEHGRGFVIPKDADIFNFIEKGTFVNEGDELFILQNAYDDEDANALLRALKSDNDVLSAGRVSIRAGHTGVVEDIIIKRTVETNELSPTLKKIVNSYENNIKNKKKQLKDLGVEDVNHNIPDIGVLPATGKLKNAQDSVYIEIYIKYHDKFSIGDKLIYGAAVKGVAKEIISEGLEPKSTYRPEEPVDALLSIGSLNARMVTSVQTRGLINKGLIELTRQCKEILGLPTDLDKK